MIAEEPVVRVHSVAEAYLYLKFVRCPACLKGPLKQEGDLTKTAAAPGGWSIETRCPDCGRRGPLNYSIQPPPTRQQARSTEINPTPHHSEAIDLLGWLTLFQSILEASCKEANKRIARDLAYEAAMCLDEALKFYRGQDELPGEEAFFNEASRRRFHDHPEHFSRSRWRERRLRLPDTMVQTRPSGEARRRRWWQFWRRRA